MASGVASSKAWPCTLAWQSNGAIAVHGAWRACFARELEMRRGVKNRHPNPIRIT